MIGNITAVNAFIEIIFLYYAFVGIVFHS